MSSTVRTFTRNSRNFSLRAAVPARAFHSPFTVLNATTSPLKTAPPPPSSLHYEKQHEHAPEPQFSHSGAQTYIVSEPDPSHTPYAVPSGAYPTSAPYVNFKPTEPPNTNDAPLSSTGSQPAHPYTTRAVPHNQSGVGESAAIRNAQAPGQMSHGSNGGLDLMDKKGSVKKGDAELASRNPPPIGDVAEKFSKAGVDEAWKQRK